MSLDAVEQNIEKEYHVSWYIIAYKMIFGLVEFVLGFIIIVFGHQGLLLYRSYARQELAEDPNDLVVRVTSNFLPNILTHGTLLSLYLMILGAAKVAGAIGLIYGKNWGVDLLVGLTVLMLPFQLVQLAFHPSLPDFIYISVGLLIALYLVNFRPRRWAGRLGEGIKNRFWG